MLNKWLCTRGCTCCGSWLTGVGRSRCIVPLLMCQ